MYSMGNLFAPVGGIIGVPKVDVGVTVAHHNGGVGDKVLKAVQGWFVSVCAAAGRRDINNWEIGSGFACWKFEWKISEGVDPVVKTIFIC